MTGSESVSPSPSTSPVDGSVSLLPGPFPVATQISEAHPAPARRRPPSFDPAQEALARSALAGTPYQLLRVLGRGGASIVFEARDLDQGELVAIKVLLPRFWNDDQMVARLEGEARILQALNHPNTVRCIGLGRTGAGAVYLVLERLLGVSLHTELRNRGTFPPPEAVAIVRAIASATARAHALGIVHRDLKPDNIMMHRAGGLCVPKLIDFGFAKLLSSDRPDILPPTGVITSNGVLIGTTRYLSPEAAANDPVDERADLYGLGLILSTLIAGRAPYDHLRDHEDVQVAHAILPAEVPSEVADVPIPAEIDAIVLRALEKEPERRFQSAQEFEEVLGTLGESLSKPQGWLETTTFDPGLIECGESPNGARPRRVFGLPQETEARIERSGRSAPLSSADGDLEGPSGAPSNAFEDGSEVEERRSISTHSSAEGSSVSLSADTHAPAAMSSLAFQPYARRRRRQVFMRVCLVLGALLGTLITLIYLVRALAHPALGIQ